MAAVATVNTAPSSPASSSSTSTTALAPRPVQLLPSGLWKPTPTLTPNFSHPMALPTPPASAALTPSTSAAVATIPRTPPTSTSMSTRNPSLKTQTATLTPTTPRSILKPGDIHPANRLPAYSPTTNSSTSSSSLNSTSKSKAQLKSQNTNGSKRRSRGKSIKEGAFFAFVLLPLSCWYTRGGKRLGASGPPPPQMVEYGDGHGGKRGAIEWDADYEVDEEVLVAGYKRRGRAATDAALPELRRPVYGLGRKDSLGQVAGGAGAPGGMKGRVIARRESFSAPVPKSVVLGHGRSNSFSSAGIRGRERDGMGLGNGMVVARREVADYGVDRGAAAVDGWDLEKEREIEFDRLRLSRAKSRTGSPVPLRRRRSEV